MPGRTHARRHRLTQLPARLFARARSPQAPWASLTSGSAVLVNRRSKLLAIENRSEGVPTRQGDEWACNVGRDVASARCPPRRATDRALRGVDSQCSRSDELMLDRRRTYHLRPGRRSRPSMLRPASPSVNTHRAALLVGNHPVALGAASDRGCSSCQVMRIPTGHFQWEIEIEELFGNSLPRIAEWCFTYAAAEECVCGRLG